MVHAESHELIGSLTDRMIAEGRTAPKHHAHARPPVSEREAAHRAITFAEVVDVPILIVHVSTRAATEQIRAAQDRGLAIYAETCPQYLFLTADDLDHPGFEGRSTAARRRLGTWTARRRSGKSCGTARFRSSPRTTRRPSTTPSTRLRPTTFFLQDPQGVPGLESGFPYYSRKCRKGADQPQPVCSFDRD